MPRVSADINTLLLSADKAAARANLDLEPGTDVLAFSAAASQAEMEAGTEAALRTMSPLRVAQAIAALSSGGGEITVQDEGTPLATAATTINFVGAGVTASGTGSTKTITISGASVDLSSYVQSDPTGVTGADAVTNIISLTQAEYDAIDPGDISASTYYIITDAVDSVFNETHAANHTLTASECYGAFYTITSAATLTLPAGANGMSLTVTTRGAVAASVKAGASDFIYLDGVALDDGDKITNSSTSGDTVVLFANSTGNWTAITDGNWTDGGA